MGCQHHDPYRDAPAGDAGGGGAPGASSFTVAMPRLTFGRGVLGELGARAAGRGFRRAALFTDPHLVDGPLVASAVDSLRSAGLDVAIFHEIRIEPDDASVQRGADFLTDRPAARAFDVIVSVGGGSVMDTAKASSVVAAHGVDVARHFAPPVGEGLAISRTLLPHIACPTTAGTGSECTSVSVLRINALDCKFVLAGPALLPIEAIVDPACLDSLPGHVLASTGFDLCCHALECWTAQPFTTRTARTLQMDPAARQYLQGANPFSDLFAQEALRITDRHLVRGVADAADSEARDRLMWGATLAGIAFGNTGTHLPHAMSYGITHLMHTLGTDGGTGAPANAPSDAPSDGVALIPHGISVIVVTPTIVRFLAEGAPERHLEAASFLGAASGATPAESGEVLSARLIELMRATGMPNGLSALGFDDSHVAPMAASCLRQARAIANAPREADLVDLENLYRGALTHW